MATIRLSSATSSLSWTTGKFRLVSYHVYRTVRHSLVGRHGPKPCWDGHSVPPRALYHSFSSLSVLCRRPDDARRTSVVGGSLHGGTNPTRSTSYDSIPPQRARCKSSVALAVDDDESERGNNSNNDPNTTVVPFLLADIGEGIREVQVLQWHVSVGDTVQEFDTICQVQSDKATVDITSRYAGTIVEIAPESTILVGQPLVHIATTKHNNDQDDRTQEHAPTPETPVAPSRSPTPGQQHQQPQHVEAPRSDLRNNQKYLASPAVRKLAADHGIDPTTLTGTGPHGRVLKGDVLHYVSAGAAATAKTTTTKTTTTAPVPNSIHEHDNDNNNGQRIVTLSGYNRSMVQSMTDSLQIPHMALGDEIVVDKLLQFRQEWNAHVAAQPPQPQQSSQGPETTPSTTPQMTKLGLQTLLVKACSLALTEFPAVNAKVHNAADCQVCYHDHHDIGVAMDTPHGLVVPVIRSVELKSLLQLQHEVDRLKTAAATGRTALSDLSPSPTFTLSNIGAIGVGTHMSPVLVPPLVAMGALGRIHKVPRYPSSSVSMDHAAVDDQEQQPVPTHVLYVSWVADHRFLDGATLARFHQAFARYASNPLLMLPQLK